MDLQELKQDVKDIKKTVGEIATTMAVNTESLIYHSARTKANEDRIIQVEKYILGLLSALLVATIGYLLSK